MIWHVVGADRHDSHPARLLLLSLTQTSEKTKESRRNRDFTTGKYDVAHIFFGSAQVNLRAHGDIAYVADLFGSSRRYHIHRFLLTSTLHIHTVVILKFCKNAGCS